VARYGRGFPHRPLTSYSLETGSPPAVATPNYTGYVVLARDRRRKPKPAIVYEPPVVGPPAPAINIPGYYGYFVHARRGARPDIRKRTHTTKLRLVPAGGFVGAKLGYLTVTPTRKSTSFTTTPTRQANLTSQ